MSLDERLRMARERKDLSQRELCKQAGLTPAHVAAIESGAIKDPASSTLVQLAAALDCDLKWLATGLGDPPNERSENEDSKPAAE